MSARIGEVYWINFDVPVKGNAELAGTHPALVVASMGKYVIIVPITGTNRSIPSHVEIAQGDGGLTKNSVAMCDQVKSIDTKFRLGKKMGDVSPSAMNRVREMLHKLIG